MHEPFILVQDNSDCRVLAVQNLTYYDPLVPISNSVLKVVVPTLNCAYEVAILNSGTSYYTGWNFGVTNTNCSRFANCLPDGIYELTYSICPNDEVYITIYHLRVTILRGEILAKLASYSICENQDFVDKLSNWLLVLQAAQSDAENRKLSSAQESMIGLLNNF